MAIVNLKQRIALCYTLFSTLIVLDIIVATSTVMFLCQTPRIFVPHENIEKFQNHPHKNCYCSLLSLSDHALEYSIMKVRKVVIIRDGTRAGKSDF